jgi:hypothetical protein
VPRPLLALLLLAVALAPGRGAADDDGPAPPRPADVVTLRFGWTAPYRAKVSFRRTRHAAGQPAGTFTARYETTVDTAEGGGLRVGTHGTTWRGALPVPPALADDALQASEQVVQRIGVEGKFQGLDGVEALRPVLARVLDEAKVPEEQAGRALALALAGTRAEAEELWNLAVGFWIGADLKIGKAYAMQSEGALPFVPGVRTSQSVEFAVRRRVPCAAGHREAECVEAVLRATPDPAALERAAPALLSRLAWTPEPQPDEPAAAPARPPVPDVRTELVLITDPRTLLPRRVVWTKSVRLGGDGEAEPDAELLDRSEWDYRWLPLEPPKPKKKRPARPAPAPLSSRPGA